jgi:hypothetical protein
MHDGLGICGPLLVQDSRFSSSNRYWLTLPVPVSCVVIWLPLGSVVRLNSPIATGEWGCADPGAGYV